MAKGNGIQGRFMVLENTPSNQLLTKYMGERMMQTLNRRGRTKKSIWMSLMSPVEIVNSSKDLMPVLPETFSPILAYMGLSSAALDEADKAGYPKEGCPFQRGILGARLYDGINFAPPDAVVGTSHFCDGTCKVFPEDARMTGSPLFLIDTPFKVTDKAVDYYVWQLGEFIKFLRKEGLADITPEMLARSAENFNEASKYIRMSEKLRNARPTPIRGKLWEMYYGVEVMALGTRLAVDYFRLYNEELQERVDKQKPAIENERHRLMWMFFTPFHNQELIDYIEVDLKCPIVFPELVKCYWEDVDPDDPLPGWARKTMSGMYVSSERRIELALESARDFDVDGVIIFTNWGCRQTIGNSEMLKDVFMKELDVPSLLLDGDVIDPRNLPIGQVRTRIEAFVEMLDERSD